MSENQRQRKRRATERANILSELGDVDPGDVPEYRRTQVLMLLVRATVAVADAIDSRGRT